ncbi:MAG: NAD-dependent epimerase/dehydratase family protein [Nitrospirae bacterium]|nr:NAD-dependent epimerase/dehydratase family protein [Nitrospirota bacterium]
MGKNTRTVFVTGATGFIGRYLVNNLINGGFRVYVFTRDPGHYAKPDERVNIITGDITQRIDLPDEIDVVYHCAGVISREDLMEDVNIQGTRMIADAALRRNCRLVHLSSAGVIGKTQEKNNIIDEHTVCRPQNLYEKTKIEAERIIKERVALGLKAQVLRPTIVFGAGRDPAKDSFFHLIAAIKAGRYRNIGGGGIYNIIHVSEVVRAMRALDNDGISNGGIYFINTPISFREFASVVRAATTGKVDGAPTISYSAAYCIAVLFSALSTVTGRKMPLTISRLKALTDKRTFSQERLLNATGYRQMFSIDHYIKQVCQEYVEMGLLG